MTAFQKWYEQNKQAFNQARADKRKADPEYAARQKLYKKKNSLPDPENGLVLSEAARQLGTTIWVLNGWKAKGLFPQPLKYKGGLWIHRDNLPVLVGLMQHFKDHPRTTEGLKGVLENRVNWVFANWTTLENPHGPE